MIANTVFSLPSTCLTVERPRPAEAEEPMREREHLAQADRFIAECTKRIVYQRDVIASAFQKGHATDVPVSMLRALEASLRAFEGHRLLIVDRQKDTERR
jgi:hypothetical protein